LQFFNDLLIWLDQFLGSAIYFVPLLIGTGIFFTFYLGFPQIKYFAHATRILRGKYTSDDAPGDTTHFQALTTALAGTVGTGNIGGVALAIFLGGPAALFWMWVTAFFGMTSKFVEVTLSHKYREKTADGSYSGGPMYFMEKKLKLKWLAILFAIATVICSFGIGNMPQINSIAVGMNESFGIQHWISGLVLACFLAFVIIGGIKRIAHVAEKIVPTMAIIYLLGALSVICMHLDNVIPSFLSIFEYAFTGSAAVGGFLGASFAFAMQRGVNRGLFSNEAGQGSAAIAHASAKGTEPVSEGMVSILEPFIDTIIICTITGLVILSSGVWSQKQQNNFDYADMKYVVGNFSDENKEDRNKLFHFLDPSSDKKDEVALFSGTLNVVDGQHHNSEITLIAARSIAENIQYKIDEQLFTGQLNIKDGRLFSTEEFEVPDNLVISGKSLIHSVKLTMSAFKQGFLGDYGQYIVSIGLLLFAFSTAIAWSYYGDRAITYMLGEKFVMPYRVVYVAAFFLAAVVDTQIIWKLSAVAAALMTIPNLVGLLLLHKDMKQTVTSYWKHFKEKPVD